MINYTGTIREIRYPISEILIFRLRREIRIYSSGTLTSYFVCQMPVAKLRARNSTSSS